MGTVSKALCLLDILKEPSSRKGLTEIARQAGFDKATTRRLLVELMVNGFVDQDDVTKNYVLGPSLQVLGKAREESFPLLRTVQPIVRAIAEETGETVHASEYGAQSLITICTQESEKANRVSLALGQKLPLHATASGIAFLAASKSLFIEQFLRKPRLAFTQKTPMFVEQIHALINDARLRGFSMSNQTLEEGIHSVAAAFVDLQGKPFGTIAVAMPSVRATRESIEVSGRCVAAAAREISNKLYGTSSLRRAS